MRILLSICFALTAPVVAVAQNAAAPILERKISIRFSNERLPIVLNQIGQRAGFSFSYKSDLIDEAAAVSIEANDQPVREVLNGIFKGKINYKQKGSHLILTRAPEPRPNSTAAGYFISGYVEDENSGNGIADASVYDKFSLASAVTDQYGFYKIKLEKHNDPATLSVSKKNYLDTVITVAAAENQYINIAIRPANDTLPAVSAKDDSTRQDEKSFPYEHEANVENIHDTLYRDIQVSILPFVGTNGRLSGNIINNYSINFFGGYARGTRQIELGFFLNSDREDVSWLQIAGIGNFVGGNVYGVQAAGFFNINHGETKALQMTGVANTNLGETWGVQLAGFANTNLKSTHGVLVAGLNNFGNGPSEGVEIAGFTNIQLGGYKGSQVAGFANIATQRITGSQISSFFNYGKAVRGTQIGLFNFADSLGGVPIGFLSFVNHGYHKIEISADEVFYTNVAFRTGARKFYNIINAGIKPEDAFGSRDNVWTFGYGAGTAPRLARWLDLNIDLTANHVNKGDFTNRLSLLNKLFVGVDMRVARKMSIVLGGTLNGYLTRNTSSDYPVLFTDHSPHVFYDHDFRNNVNMKMWWGLKAGLRFL